MLLRALAIWCVLLVVAFANGMARVAWIIPRTGERAGHVISCLTLSAAIGLLAWASIGWVGPATPADAVAIGAVWLVLTLAFELGAGHYVFRQPWSALLEDYNLARGRLWVLVLIATALSPLWAGWVRGLFVAHPAWQPDLTASRASAGSTGSGSAAIRTGIGSSPSARSSSAETRGLGVSMQSFLDGTSISYNPAPVRSQRELTPVTTADDGFARLRASWFRRQGLSPRNAPKTIPDCVRRAGWLPKP